MQSLLQNRERVTGLSVRVLKRLGNLRPETFLAVIRLEKRPGFVRDHPVLSVGWFSYRVIGP